MPDGIGPSSEVPSSRVPMETVHSGQPPAVPLTHRESTVDNLSHEVLPGKEAPLVTRTPLRTAGHIAKTILTSPLKLIKMIGRMFSAAARVFQKQQPEGTPQMTKAESMQQEAARRAEQLGDEIDAFLLEAGKEAFAKVDLSSTQLGWKTDPNAFRQEQIDRGNTRDVPGVSAQFSNEAFKDMNRALIYNGVLHEGKGEQTIATKDDLGNATAKLVFDDLVGKMGNTGSPEERATAALIAMEGMSQTFDEESLVHVHLSAAKEDLSNFARTGDVKQVSVEVKGEEIEVSVTKRYQAMLNMTTLVAGIVESTRTYSVNIHTGEAIPKGETYTSIPLPE